MIVQEVRVDRIGFSTSTDSARLGPTVLQLD